jgi:hypothetical protein
MWIRVLQYLSSPAVRSRRSGNQVEQRLTIDLGRRNLLRRLQRSQSFGIRDLDFIDSTARGRGRSFLGSLACGGQHAPNHRLFLPEPTERKDVRCRQPQDRSVARVLLCQLSTRREQDRA